MVCFIFLLFLFQSINSPCLVRWTFTLANNCLIKMYALMVERLGYKLEIQGAISHLGTRLQMATGYPRDVNRSEIDTVKTIRKVETIVKLEAICLREIRDTRMDYHGIPARNLRTASLKVPLAILHPLVFNRQISTIFHQTRIYSNLPPYRVLSKPSHRPFSTVRFTRF